MKTTYTPLSLSNRIEIIDFLRGIALFGILMVNMPLMNAPATTEIGEFSLWNDQINEISTWVIRFFFTSKFYVLFSLLFGLGFYFFMQKASDNQGKVVALYRKRLFWLLFFGMAHILLLWYGDILVAYAIAGFFLILFRKKSIKTLLIWACVFLFIPVILMTVFAVSINAALQIPEASQEMLKSFDKAFASMKLITDNALYVYANGSFAQIISIRLTEYVYMLNAYFFFLPSITAMFLIGMAMGKARIFENIQTKTQLFKKILFYSLPIAISGNIMFTYFADKASMVMPTYESVFYILGMSWGGPAMTFVYISLISLSFHKIVCSKFGRAIINTGRMALTNYIMQSVICTSLFYSYGLGLYGSINIWQGIIMVIAIFTVQVIMSCYWMQQIRFGPLEWLWRSLTYWTKQKMKKDI
jgi:uncharacterized protein